MGLRRPCQQQIRSWGLNEETFPSPNPDAATDIGHKLCPWKLFLLSHALWFSCSLSFCLLFQLWSLFLFVGQMYSITTDWILLERKCGCYVLHLYISTIKGLSLFLSPVCKFLGKILCVQIWVPFQGLDQSPVVTGVREGKNMTLPESTLAGEGEHLSKKEAWHFKGSRNMACVGISM